MTTTDIKFACSSCGQRMLVDAEAAGMAVDCPHCAASMTIPKLGALHDRQYPNSPTRKRDSLLSGVGPSAPRESAPAKDDFIDPELTTLRQELLEASVQATRLESELADARTEADKLRHEFKTATKDQRDRTKKATETQRALDTLRAEKEAMAARLANVEAERDQAAANLRVRELELNDERAQHVITQGDRTTTARELEALKATAAQLETNLVTARAGVAAGEKAAQKLAVTERELSDTRNRFARTEADLNARQIDLAKANDEVASLRRSLAENTVGKELIATREELAATGKERDNFAAQARQLTSDLAKTEAARAERDDQIKSLRSELDEARRRAEAAGEVRLRQDNEVLRGIIARQNSELEQKHVHLARLKRARFGVRLAYAGFAIALVGIAAWAIKVVPQLGTLLKF
jgi:chromosome segregation ATPase